MRYFEGQDSFVFYDKRSITVDELLIKVRGKRPRHFNALWLRDNALGNPRRYDQARILAADSMVPIIVVVKDEPYQNDVLLVLDGAHRIMKATQNGDDYVPAYCLTLSELREPLSEHFQYELDVWHGLRTPYAVGTPEFDAYRKHLIRTQMAEQKRIADQIKPIRQKDIQQ